MPLPDAPWIGMHPEDYRESIEPLERYWDAENDQECDNNLAVRKQPESE